MDVVPHLRLTRFEQIDPGDLFFCFANGQKFYAIKTLPENIDERGAMVILGPGLLDKTKGSMILPWRSESVLSFGKDFSVVLSCDPSNWSLTRVQSNSVCLALYEDKLYVATNGGPSPENYFACFVDIKTGAVLEGVPYGPVAYIDTWEIVVLNERHPHSVLKHPTRVAPTN